MQTTALNPSHRATPGAPRSRFARFIVASTCRTFKQLCLQTGNFATHARADTFEVVNDAVAHHGQPASATISRVLFTGVQPNQALRNVLTKRPPLPRGPISAVLLVLSVVSALYAAFRRFVISRTKKCSKCRGYGVERCPLCDGAGSITWEGKWDHVEPCPRCMGMRFCNCSKCGGLYHHTLFTHISRNAGLQSASAARRGGDTTLEPLLD